MLFQTGSFSEDMIPTVGFNMRKVTKGNVSIKLWDLGGQTRFRSMWERYCRGVNAIVFVVDAADHNTLEVARNELHNLLKPQDGKENPLAGIPLLVLGNKKDLPGALTERELIERMDLQTLAQARARLQAPPARSPHPAPPRAARCAPTASRAKTSSTSTSRLSG